MPRGTVTCDNVRDDITHHPDIAPRSQFPAERENRPHLLTMDTRDMKPGNADAYHELGNSNCATSDKVY